MKCPECKAEDMLYGEVTLKVSAPLARGGGLKLGGIGVKQEDIKKAWETNISLDERTVHGPITCLGCESEFHYVVGETPALKPGRCMPPIAKTADEDVEETSEEEE